MHIWNHHAHSLSLSIIWTTCDLNRCSLFFLAFSVKKNSEMTQREVATGKRWVAEELKERIMKGMNECWEKMCPAECLSGLWPYILNKTHKYAVQICRCLCCMKEPWLPFGIIWVFGGRCNHWDGSHKCTRLWPILWSGNVRFSTKKILMSPGREFQLLSITPETFHKAAIGRDTFETLDLYVPVICNCSLLISRCLGVRSKTSDAVSWRMSSACWSPWILE